MAMRNCVSIILSAAICLLAPPSRAGGTVDADDTEGISTFEYVDMTVGCTYIPDDATRKSCESVTAKLLPQMVPDKPPPPFPKLTGAEVAAIEIGCGYLKEGRDKAWCVSGIKKLRTHVSASN
jgi:hypothetical protein